MKGQLRYESTLACILFYLVLRVGYCIYFVISRPGAEHRLDLSATRLTSSGTREIKPQDRGCYFSDEGNLDFYKQYSYKSCQFECKIRLVLESSQSLDYCSGWLRRLQAACRGTYPGCGTTPYAIPGPSGSLLQCWRGRRTGRSAVTAWPTASTPTIAWPPARPGSGQYQQFFNKRVQH